MAFSTITSAQIEVGEPTKAELFQKIKDNQDDLNTRLTTVEANINNPFPIRFEMLGKYGAIPAPTTGIMYHRVNVAITLTGAVLMLYEAGSSGTTEVDIQKSAAGGGSFSTIFSTKPSVATATDFTVSTNAVLSTTSISAGEILRFDLTSKQSGIPDGFELIVSYTID